MKRRLSSLLVPVLATDPCEPGDTGVSYIYATGQYFLRTLSGHPLVPTRWLVLDFGDFSPAAASESTPYC